MKCLLCHSELDELIYAVIVLEDINGKHLTLPLPLCLKCQADERKVRRVGDAIMAVLNERVAKEALR